MFDEQQEYPSLDYLILQLKNRGYERKQGSSLLYWKFFSQVCSYWIINWRKLGAEWLFNTPLRSVTLWFLQRLGSAIVPEGLSIHHQDQTLQHSPNLQHLLMLSF